LIRKPSSANSFIKYSGIAVQLFVLLFIGALIGREVDIWFHTPKPYFTILFILLFAGGFFYRLIKDLSRKDDA
jgi:hypothetical protein